MSDAPADAPAPEPRRHPALATLLRVGILALAAAIVVVVATHYDRWTGEARIQRTDDAYLTGDVTAVAARVGGIVQDTPVNDYARVQVGTLLVQIRDDDYRAQLAQAEADLAGARAQLLNVQSQRPLQQAMIAAAKDTLDAMVADVARDEAEAARQRSLLSSGIAGTRQLVEQADARRAETAANTEKARAMLQAAIAQLAIVDAQEQAAEASIKGRQAALDLARINLGYTAIKAPAEGEVGQRLVRPGQYVAVGTQVIALVSLPNVWVIANYKETQLTRITPGQPATITVDAFPGTVLRGKVESVSPGSGSQFSLLPADNATGNFTKVVQRIPVKIVLDDTGALRDRLRPGMSVTAAIETRQ